MKLAVTIFAVLLSNLICAQQKTKTIYKDTINVRGYILMADGHPANARIFSRGMSIKIDGSGIESNTDSTGYFELAGVSPIDTFRIISSGGIIILPNKGSRYLLITTPNPTPRKMNSAVTVTAIRKYAPVIPKFEVLIPEKDKGLVFSDGENAAEYPGGLNKFFGFIQSHLQYPKSAVEHNVEGTVEVSFVINTKGFLTDIKIISGLGYGCDEEVIGALKMAPRWKPEIHQGKIVDSNMIIPVSFKLSDRLISR